jgi:hypothetical protein
MSEPHFDLHAFHHPRLGHNVEGPFAEQPDGLTYDDFAAMRVKRTVTPKYLSRVPEWALSDECVRAVVLQKLRRQATARGWKMKKAKVRKSDSVHSLDRKATVHIDLRGSRYMGANQRKLIRTHNERVKHLTNAEMIIAIIYQTYRLGYNSVTVASNLNISPPLVRQMLARLNAIARQLFAEKCLPPRRYGGPLTRKTYLKSKINELCARLAGPMSSKRRPKVLAELNALQNELDRQGRECEAASVLPETEHDFSAGL